MNQQEQPLPDVAGWQVFAMQLIAFPIGPALGTGAGWWEAVADQADPESTTRRGEREDKGIVDGRTLTLKVEFNRILWTASATSEPANAEQQTIEMPTAGPFPLVKDWFVGLMDGWLNGLQMPVKRLAFATSLLRRADSHEASYLHVAQYLRGRVNLDPVSSDFLYRINRKRTWAGVNPALTINRLSTWSNKVLSVHAGEIAPGAQVQPPGHAIQDGVYYTAVDIDVNSSHERQEVIGQASLVPLFRELTTMANEIAARGDIA